MCANKQTKQATLATQQRHMWGMPHRKTLATAQPAHADLYLCVPAAVCVCVCMPTSVCVCACVPASLGVFLLFRVCFIFLLRSK